MYALGFLHLHGLGGVKQDKELAHTMLLAAAEMGSVSATYQLGILYLRGDATPYGYEAAAASAASGEGMGIKSYSIALQLLSKAANSGHHKAMYNLGQMYLHGIGVPQSCDLAVKLLKTVAEQQYLRLSRGEYLLPVEAESYSNNSANRKISGVSPSGEVPEGNIPDVRNTYTPVRRGGTMARRALVMVRSICHISESVIHHCYQ